MNGEFSLEEITVPQWVSSAHVSASVADDLGHLPEPKRREEGASGALISGNEAGWGLSKAYELPGFCEPAKGLHEDTAPEAAFRSKTWSLTGKPSPIKLSSLTEFMINLSIQNLRPFPVPSDLSPLPTEHFIRVRWRRSLLSLILTE